MAMAHILDHLLSLCLNLLYIRILWYHNSRLLRDSFYYNIISRGARVVISGGAMVLKGGKGEVAGRAEEGA